MAVVDSFHVIQWITRSIDNYIRQLERKFRQRDREKEEQLSLEQGHPVTLPVSDEVYLLKRYKWLILSSQKNITYHPELRMDPHFHRLMNTYDYESALFRTDPHLKKLRSLKEDYLQFNSANAGLPKDAAVKLEEIIDSYMNSNEPIFIDFACLLCKYRDPIINSFVMVEKCGPGGIYDSRLSNGPIESINRKIKDLKRSGRGFRNFEHLRNRFLFSTRNKPVLNGSPLCSQVQYYAEDDDI